MWTFANEICRRRIDLPDKGGTLQGMLERVCVGRYLDLNLDRGDSRNGEFIFVRLTALIHGC